MEIQRGGYAALNFGFLLGGVNIISAVPQYDLLAWIRTYKPHLSYILPDRMDEESECLYRNILKSHILNSNKCLPKVYLITSHNDNTYEDHIPDLLKDCRKKNVKIEVVHEDELYITRHNNVVANCLNYIYYYISKWLCEADLNLVYEHSCNS